ncbi:MAG: amidohydrolase [Clostridia bacterium]
MEILFKNATIVTVDDDNFVINNAYLGVDDGKIVYLSQNEPKIRAKREIDATGKVLMPGLVNAHTHIPMAVLRGYADDYALNEWLNEHIFPAEAKLDAKCVEIGAKLAIAEMISTGTTSLTDMYFKEPTVAKVLADSGMRGNLCNATLFFGEKYNHLEDNAYTEFTEMMENFHGFDNGRIKVDAGIHGEYTSNCDVWEFWRDEAKKDGLNVHIHVSETKFEHEECKKRHDGLTPVQVFEKYGVLENRASLAHCVYIEEADMEILAAKNASVAHNPVSNLKLGSGIANVAKMLEKGVNVALGTDGVASNNTHDLFEELKLCALLAKGTTCNPQAVDAKQAIKMATINGAKSQNRDNVGKLCVGFDADVIMLDFENLYHTPTYDVLSGIVYNTSGRDVLMTMIQGKILYENGEFSTIDVAQAKKELEEYVIPRIKA